MRMTGSLRIGDADRDVALDLLARHFSDGRLTRVEYEERMTSALEARTQADLSALFHDLPALDDVSLAPARAGSRPSFFLPAVVVISFLLLLPMTAFMFFHAAPILVAFLGFVVIARRAGCSSRRTSRRAVERGAWDPRAGRGPWPPQTRYGGRP